MGPSMPEIPQGIFGGLLIGAVIGNWFWVRRILLHWRLSLRREAILAQGFHDLNYSLGSGRCTYEDVAHAVTVMGIALADELNNQLRHEGDFWLRVPQLGKSWPDFEPAEVTVIGGEDDDA